MSEHETYSLNHFATYRFLPSYWGRTADERKRSIRSFVQDLRGATEFVHLYQTHPLEADTDLLVWSTFRVTDPERPRAFFEDWARVSRTLRAHAEFRHSLWGFTRPSQYSKARSSQEIDPFTEERSPYLVMYPFTKTAEWYLLGPDARQGMMNEHMRIGKQYREITQLLLYSFGLQDQEFVVVYETDDLQRFSKLVYELRDTEARRYTKADTPLHTGIHHSLEGYLERLA